MILFAQPIELLTNLGTYDEWLLKKKFAAVLELSALITGH